MAFLEKLLIAFGFLRETQKIRIGRLGENAAEKLLKKRRLKILERNWRFGKLEVDIIARERRAPILVFVEVKTRAENALVSGYYAGVSAKKRDNIHRAALKYMNSCNGQFISWRYDVVEVKHSADGKISGVSHFENVGFRKQA